MAESSEQRSSGGNQSSNRNRSRNRGGGNRGGSGGNRGGGGGNRNSNRGGRSQGGGGNRSHKPGGSRGFVKQKVPRRTRPLTLWEKFLNLFGLGPKRRQPPQSSRPPREGNAAASLKSAPTDSGKGKQQRDRKPAAKKSTEPKKERPARPLEKVEVTGTRLHVGNLSYDTADADLEKLFGEIGPVASAEVVEHNRSGRSKGFAFVEMESVDDAKRAAAELHDKDFMGRMISVGGAKSRKPTDDR